MSLHGEKEKKKKGRDSWLMKKEKKGVIRKYEEIESAQARYGASKVLEEPTRRFDTI